MNEEEGEEEEREGASEKKLEQLQVCSHFYIEKQLKAKRESRQKKEQLKCSIPRIFG